MCCSGHFLLAISDIDDGFVDMYFDGMLPKRFHNQYKHTYVCIACCSARKYPYEMSKSYVEQDTKPCAKCKSVSYNVGRHFKTPPKKKLDQWEKVRRIIQAGFRFEKTFSPYPEHLRDADEFIEKRLSFLKRMWEQKHIRHSLDRL